MVEQTDLENIYEITGNKTSFSKDIKEEWDPITFNNFRYLFQEIDSICSQKIIYI